MRYIVVEMQNGMIGGNTWTYSEDQYLQAESKYHSILATAATSQVYIHTALLLNETGFMIKHESYDHTPAPEPEPEVE